MRPQHMVATAMQPTATIATKFLKLSFAFMVMYYITIRAKRERRFKSQRTPAIRHNNVHPGGEGGLFQAGPFVKYCAPW